METRLLGAGLDLCWPVCPPTINPAGLHEPVQKVVALSAGTEKWQDLAAPPGLRLGMQLGVGRGTYGLHMSGVSAGVVRRKDRHDGSAPAVVWDSGHGEERDVSCWPGAPVPSARLWLAGGVPAGLGDVEMRAGLGVGGTRDGAVRGAGWSGAPDRAWA